MSKNEKLSFTYIVIGLICIIVILIFISMMSWNDGFKEGIKAHTAGTHIIYTDSKGNDFVLEVVPGNIPDKFKGTTYE